MGALQNQMIAYMKARGYSTKTIKAYSSNIRTISYHYMKSPLEITKAQIEAFFLYLRDQGKSESTLHLYYASFKFFYSMHSVLDRVPHMTFRRSSSALPEILSQKEVFQLLSCCTNMKYRTIFTLIYSAGLRVSEAANLTLRDIDFERRLIFIRNAKNKKDRYTLLANETSVLLKDYLRIYRPAEYLFYGRNDPSKRISIDSIQRSFKTLVRLRGVRKRIHIHTLRHCFATHLIENGTNIFYVMQLLGHSNIQTTLVYLHMRSLDSLDIRSPIDDQKYRFYSYTNSSNRPFFLESA